MSLAGGDATDDATVTFLLSAALSEKKEKEEERRKREEELREEERKKLERRRAKALKGWDEEALWQLNRRIQAGSTLSSAEYAAWYFWDGGVSSSSSASGLVKRRKRKKKKKRLPRTRLPRVMFPYVVVRPEMLCIMADMDQKDSTLRATLAVACVSLVLLVTLHLALCSFTLSSGSGCFASWPGRLRRTVMQLVSCLGLVLLVSLHLALCSLCFSARQAHCRPAQDARHHGRYGSEGQVVARSGMCTGGFTGYSAPRAVFFSIVAWP